MKKYSKMQLIITSVAIDYFFYVLLAMSVVMVLVPILYSYIYYKKNKQM